MCKIILLIISLLLAYYSSGFPQSIPEEDKRGIVRIETPEGKLGTGFTLSDSALGFFLVTNKHVVTSSINQEYFDSVYIRSNKLESGKVMATADKSTLYLRYKGIKLFAEHYDSNIDLIIIQLGNLKIGDRVISNPANFEWIHGIKMKAVANRKNMDSLQISDGSFVQIVGFSFQAPQKPQFHICRFGYIALFSNEKIVLNFQVPYGDSTHRVKSEAEWLIIDVISRGGDSGGPVFAFHPITGERWVVGLIKGGSDLNEYCVAHPSYYIWELVKLISESLK